MNEQTASRRQSAPEGDQREPVFNVPAVIIGLIALCVVVHGMRVYLFDIDRDTGLLLRAAFIPVRYSGIYDLDVYAFTSPFTYAFLHGGWAHLIINMIWLAAFGSPLANRLGVLRLLSFWAVTGLAAAALHWAIHPLDQAPLVGASGAISGMMGAAARFGFRMDRSGGAAAFAGPPWPIADVVRSRSVMTFLAIWMIVNLVTGLAGVGAGNDATIAWEAHVGGFLSGFFGLRVFLSAPR